MDKTYIKGIYKVGQLTDCDVNVGIKTVSSPLGMEHRTILVLEFPLAYDTILDAVELLIGQGDVWSDVHSVDKLKKEIRESREQLLQCRRGESDI